MQDRRGGVSLVEGVVALALLGVILSALGPLVFLAEAGVADGAQAAAMPAEAYTELSLERMQDSEGCSTVGGPRPHTRCISLNAGPGDRSTVVTIVITPPPSDGRLDAAAGRRTAE